MSKQTVRVPIVGFVQLTVDAPNRNAAAFLAYSLINASLSPRDGVTDLNTLLSAEDFCLSADSSTEPVCIDEDYIDF